MGVKKRALGLSRQSEGEVRVIGVTGYGQVLCPLGMEINVVR
jgi:hypothetical protein